jgi:hypothetical protein
MTARRAHDADVTEPLMTAGDLRRRHGAVTFELSLRIGNWVKTRELGRVYAAETGFQIESAPDTVRAPDISFVSKERLPDVEPVG